MYLEELYAYKNQLMEDLLTDEKIVSLIDDTVSLEDAHTLVYKNVFPAEYVPETVQNGQTFICCDVDIQKSLNKTFLLPTLYIWVFAHRSSLWLPNGEGVRTDVLCSEISKKINGSRNYGLGTLDLMSVKRFAPMTDYQGKVMTFYATDFNRPNSPGKPVPGYRRANGC